MLEHWNEELKNTVAERTEKLVQAQRKRYELLQNIFHNIHSPLTIVQGGIRAMALGIQVEPGEAFGELSLLDGKPRSATAQTLEETKLISISRGSFMKVLHPTLSSHTM